MDWVMWVKDAVYNFQSKSDEQSILNISFNYGFGNTFLEVLFSEFLYSVVHVETNKSLGPINLKYFIDFFWH